MFTSSEHLWLEPHEKLSEFTSLFNRHKTARILDLGCGTGRHTVVLAKDGFDTYGCDISENGLAYAFEWLKREGLSAHLDRMDMTNLDYPDGYFDGVISFFVIYHNPLSKIRQTISSIYRILQPGGWAYLSFLSKRGYRYGHGQEIEPNTYLTTDGDDAGQPHHYSDLAELECEMKAFIIHRVELEEELTPEGQRHSHWFVLNQKPEPATL
jgi:SAM-dependent methyltransferase